MGASATDTADRLQTDTPTPPPDAGVGARRHVAWLAGGLIGGFLVPFVLADRLGLQRDVYYGIYALFVFGLAAGWMRDTDQSLRELVSRRWRLALGLVIGFSALAVFLVLKASDGSGHPGGLGFVSAVFWRGIVYGAADGVLLTAFPIVVVYAAFNVRPGRSSRRRTVRVGALALATSMLFTAVYHLGYSDFRSKKVAKPMAGDLVWSPPTLLTANPIGGPIVHMTMHVTAVTDDYKTDVFLPPH